MSIIRNSRLVSWNDVRCCLSACYSVSSRFLFSFFASSILYTQRRFSNANHFQRTTTRTSVYSGRPAGANHRQRQRGKRGSRHNAAAVLRRHHVVTRLSRPIGPSREECFPHKLLMSAKWTVGYRKDDNFCIIIDVVVVAVVAVHVVIENTKPTHRKSEYTSSQSTSSDSRQHSRVVEKSGEEKKSEHCSHHSMFSKRCRDDAENKEKQRLPRNKTETKCCK